MVTVCTVYVISWSLNRNISCALDWIKIRWWWKFIIDYALFVSSCDPGDHNATQVSINNGVVCNAKWLSKRNCSQYATCTECLAKWPTHINEEQVTVFFVFELCILSLIYSQTVYVSWCCWDFSIYNLPFDIYLEIHYTIPVVPVVP
jgi:hypothetical protein